MSAAASLGAVALPFDVRLPQLQTLLDVDRVAPILARSLGAAQDVGPVRVRYLRYKPGVRLLVSYDVSVGEGTHVASVLAEPESDLAALAADARHSELARSAADRSPAGHPLFWDRDLRVLIQWLPLDITMPALAIDVATLRRKLRSLGVALPEDGAEPALLAYKARRRAVVRLDAHVVKIYAGEAEFAAARAGLRGSARLDGIDVPRCEAIADDLQLTCQALVAGAPATGAEAAVAAGALARTLHASRLEELRPVPPAAQLAAAAASARSVSAVVPALGATLESFVRRLEENMPSGLELVPAHGDYHAGQLVLAGSDPVLIDFDELCAAPAALDLSSYLAHLVDGGEAWSSAVAGGLAGLLSGYGDRPAGLAWYLATSILRRAPFPFRFLRDDWPERTRRMVAAAESALERPTRTPARRRAVPAADPALPHVRQLLDPQAMQPVLARCLEGQPEHVGVSYAQYRPGRSLLVAYEVSTQAGTCEAVAFARPGSDLRESAQGPANLTLAELAAPRCPATVPLSYQADVEALIQWPPLDLRLPALAEPPARLRARLEAAGVRGVSGADLPELVHYKPRRRAVFRLGEHFVKVYADDDAFDRAVSGLRNAQELPIRTAASTAILPELRLQAQSLVAGREPAGPAEVARAAGSLLAAIHAGVREAPRHAPASWRLRQAAGHVQTISALVPSLAGRLEVLLRDLERMQPDDGLVPCHGDFFSRQMLDLDGDYAVIDFDSACMSPPALDIATYVSSVVATRDDLHDALQLAAEVAAGYGRTPAGISWFLAAVLLRRATIPFRRQAVDWPEQIERRLDAAVGALMAE
jgi:Ser/Thr protein kinase RdoA (MazF antagonist)